MMSSMVIAVWMNLIAIAYTSGLSGLAAMVQNHVNVDILVRKAAPNHAAFRPSASFSYVSTRSTTTTLVNVDVETEYPDFDRLQQALIDAGFTLEVSLPPVQGSYGLLERANRVIWINPVVFELGIAEHTLVHEAVHAAQQCANPDELLPLGLGLVPPNIVRPYFMRYDGLRRIVEAEAYTVQALDNRVEYVIGLLAEYCLDREA